MPSELRDFKRSCEWCDHRRICKFNPSKIQTGKQVVDWSEAIMLAVIPATAVTVLIASWAAEPPGDDDETF
jgi:hypothetical protein